MTGQVHPLGSYRMAHPKETIQYYNIKSPSSAPLALSPAMPAAPSHPRASHSRHRTSIQSLHGYRSTNSRCSRASGACCNETQECGALVGLHCRHMLYEIAVFQPLELDHVVYAGSAQLVRERSAEARSYKNICNCCTIT